MKKRRLDEVLNQILSLESVTAEQAKEFDGLLSSLKYAAPELSTHYWNAAAIRLSEVLPGNEEARAIFAGED